MKINSQTTTMLTIALVALIATASTTNAQCANGKVAMHQCLNNKCHKVCVDSSQVLQYQQMGYGMGTCAKTTFCGGPFRVDEQSNAAEANLLSVYPSPASDHVTIVFSLEQAGLATLNLFDAMGQCVLVVAERSFNAGENTMSLNIDAKLADGAYTLLLRTPDDVLVEKLMLLK